MHLINVPLAGVCVQQPRHCDKHIWIYQNANDRAQSKLGAAQEEKCPINIKINQIVVDVLAIIIILIAAF